MQTWEYGTLSVVGRLGETQQLSWQIAGQRRELSSYADETVTEPKLAALGAAGWEYVGLRANGAMLFKRPLESP
ncbi:MAG: hypothetical protein ACJ72D_11425 [Marmoricola sp.]